MATQETAFERDFNNFYLRDDPLQLANGLMPEIADAFDLDLTAQSHEDSLGALVGLLGTNKVLRNNEQVTALTGPQMADFLDRSGVQLALNRNLWTPDSSIQDVKPDAVIITGAVANWQDRTAKLVIGQIDPSVRIHYATSGRQMSSASELANPNVQHLIADLGEPPTESLYAARVLIPQLIDARFSVTAHQYANVTGDQLAEKLFADNPELVDQALVIARVANAGIQAAIQMRTAARKIRPSIRQQLVLRFQTTN